MQISEGLSRELFEYAPDAILLVDRTGRIVNCNEQVETLFGYRRDELIGQDVEALMPERFHNRRIRDRESYFAAPRSQRIGSGLNLFGKRRDGSEFPIDVSLVHLNKNNNGLVIAVIRDITNRHRAQEQVENQLKRLAVLRAINRAITASLDANVTLNFMLDKITSELQVDAANVLLLKHFTRTLTYAAGRGFRTAALQHTHLRLGEGLAGQAALQRNTVVIPDLHSWLAENPSSTLRLPPTEGFTAYIGVPLIAKGQVVGVLEIWHRAPLAPSPDWFDYMEALGAQAAIAIDSAQLFENLQRSTLELELAYDTTIEGWCRALELRDIESEGHTLRVTEITVRLARTVGISETELTHIRRGALLHDIGKMAIPDSILLKPDKLTEKEWKIMRKHPQYAYEMLRPIAYLRPALDIPYCHHEKWNGSGYPRGLKGEQIPLAARVFAVADVYDALRSDRPYRKGWPKEKVHEHIRTNSGTHFDPQLVMAFMKLL